MGLTKGRKNNANGRPQGNPNKTSKELREHISQFISNNLISMQNDFDTRESPKDRLMFMERLFQYTISKLQAQSIEFKQEKTEYKNLPPWMLEAVKIIRFV
jgi:hypothetical protein